RVCESSLRLARPRVRARSSDPGDIPRRPAPATTERRRPMVVEYIRYKIDPSRNDEFDQAYRRPVPLLDASPHCQRWEAARCVDDPEKQIVRIEWDSTEGHLQGFRQSADFK